MNFAVLSMEIPITNQLQIVCHFSLDPNGNVDQLSLSHTLGRDPNESLIQKSNVIRDKALRKDLSLGLKNRRVQLTYRKKIMVGRLENLFIFLQIFI